MSLGELAAHRRGNFGGETEAGKGVLVDIHTLYGYPTAEVRGSEAVGKMIQTSVSKVQGWHEHSATVQQKGLSCRRFWWHS